MDLRKLKTLVDLVAESGISELEITEAEGTVRIVKSPPAAPPAPAWPWPMPPQVMPIGNPPSMVAGAPADNPSASGGAPASAAPVTGQVVKSPMVGTFYRSPNPESEAFVSAGSSVAVGDALCIIEAMKLMNEIESEVSGTVRQVLVENGQPVEYGQPMFIID